MKIQYTVDCRESPSKHIHGWAMIDCRLQAGRKKRTHDEEVPDKIKVRDFLKDIVLRQKLEGDVTLHDDGEEVYDDMALLSDFLHNESDILDVRVDPSIPVAWGGRAEGGTATATPNAWAKCYGGYAEGGCSSPDGMQGGRAWGGHANGATGRGGLAVGGPANSTVEGVTAIAGLADAGKFKLNEKGGKGGAKKSKKSKRK
ncbi:hypothetical protein FBEOM_4726 [Fusarium beomiforme]|uniref:Uncharacterized protein n=1 Tax=Fusarium beomiforme TaxID=44412 RepID=A0A9P5AP73_9HYPO|nr:hypothetical protein FBEOM_4726 [Fusarium beomiforme]